MKRRDHGFSATTVIVDSLVKSKTESAQQINVDVLAALWLRLKTYCPVAVVATAIANPSPSPQSTLPVIGSCGIEEITNALARFSMSPISKKALKKCKKIIVDPMGLTPW